MRFARSRPTVATCMADGSSLWRHTTTTTLGTRCRSAGAVHPINYTDGFHCAQGLSLDTVRRSLETAMKGEGACAPDILLFEGFRFDRRSGELFRLGQTGQDAPVP